MNFFARQMVANSRQLNPSYVSSSAYLATYMVSLMSWAIHYECYFRLLQNFHLVVYPPEHAVSLLECSGGYTAK